MIGSLFTGISGLSVNSQAMQIIGDNIANVNTTAFKSNRSLFGDILSQSLEGGAFRKLGMGRGVQLLGSNPLWSQGSIETTNRSTDLAINGKGFFVVKEVKEAGDEATYYTRAGDFGFDKDGRLVNPGGLILLGYVIGEDGKPIGNLTDIEIPSGASPPKYTSTIRTNLNLNADSSGGTRSRVTIDGSPTAGVGIENADVTFTAISTGTAGDSIQIVYAATTGTPLSVSVAGNVITIDLETDGGGVVQSTAADVAAAVNADAYAAVLVSASAEGNGSGLIQSAAAGTFSLSGGGLPVAATLTVDCSGGEGSDVIYTAVTPGPDGNDITIEYLDPGAASAPLTVTVTGDDITVSLATDAAGLITSTATQIAAAIAADANASALVTATLKDGAGAGTVEAKAATALSGGVNSSPDTFSSTITVYDSLGNDMPLTMDFTCLEPGRWQWTASVPSNIGSSGSTGVIRFDEYGNLDVPNSGGGNPSINIEIATGAATPLEITWNYCAGSLSNGSITGYGSPSTMTFQSQDGYAPGTVQSVSVDETGVVSGVYSNGRMVPLFQIALADFPSYEGLDRIGKNLYAESIDSGQATYGTADKGALGRISPSSLEMSNVDLADQFVKMITTQRAFQANSKVITTSDEILQELMTIKR
ncbi:MAG: flagellar hook-basal body complex protein [Deltaproteobacteria bacterium]|nr:flagellar hook-basal body complex protein [Deltaproteobacteria bacterium]